MCNGIVPILLLCVLSQASPTARQSQAYIGGCRSRSTSSTKHNLAELDAMAERTGPTGRHVLQLSVCDDEHAVDVRSHGRRAVLGVRVLAWAETMISKAVVIDRFGRRNWPGPWNSPYAKEPIYYGCGSIRAQRSLRDSAQIILTSAKLRTTYGERARRHLRVRGKGTLSIKELDDGQGFFWHLYQVKQRGHQMSDKTALILRLLANVYMAGRKEKYRQRGQRVGFGLSNNDSNLSRSDDLTGIGAGDPNAPAGYCSRQSVSVWR